MTTKTRFEQALTSIREAGYHAELNTEECCRSCAVAAAPTAGTHAPGVMAHERKALWSHDGNRLSALYDDTRETVATLFFNFASIEAARACRKAFRKQGFTVTWNGRKTQCVKVHLAA